MALTADTPAATLVWMAPSYSPFILSPVVNAAFEPITALLGRGISEEWGMLNLTFSIL